MKAICILVSLLAMSLASVSVQAEDLSVENLARVPRVFTGNSSAPAYQNYAPYRQKLDERDSRGFAGYKLDLNLVEKVRADEGIWSVHTHVRNIARDGLCGDYTTCFRVYVFLNGDENTGHHVATFVVSPGTGRRTPLSYKARLRTFTRWLYKFEKPTQFESFDMYRIYGSKSYPGKIPNMPNAMFYLDAIAIHGSFDTVDGNKRSHGCIRMNPDESYWLHSLVIEASGNLTIDVLHTT